MWMCNIQMRSGVMMSLGRVLVGLALCLTAARAVTRCELARYPHAVNFIRSSLEWEEQQADNVHLQYV